MPNEVTLRIDGEDFKYWDSLNITRPIDSFSTFGLTVPFDPDVPLLRKTLVPFSYKPVELEVDGELLITGTLFVLPELAGESNKVTCSGYAKPGVLNDCEFTQESYPLEFNEVNLQTIAAKAAQPFGVSVVFDDPPGDIFDEVAAQPSSKVFNFLIGLAKQRELLINDTPQGAARFYRPAESGAAVAAIHQDQDRFLSGKPVFNEQQYYSSVTGLSPNRIARFAEEFTVDNSQLPIVRPHTFTIADTTDVSIQEVVRAKIGRMFADSVKYQVTLQGWRDDNGDIWAPNTLVKLSSPGIMVYRETELVVKSVRLTRGSTTGDQAELTLVLPGAYNGKVPEVLPWQA